MAEPLNICVVDDDRDVAEGLAEILELAGHQVRTAFTGQEALGILDAADCDIAFINATLPELNTLESFMAIRKAKPGLRAVMMTGYTVEQLVKQTVREGSVSVLQKPVTMDEVVRGLEFAKPKGIVLVADDRPEIGPEISETLRLQDHRVAVARTVDDALDKVFADDCDVLVLDLRLPVIDALEAYLDLEKQGRAIPTIIITGISDKASGQNDLLRNPVVTGVFVKPFDPARLVASLEAVHKPAAAPPAERPVEKVAQPAANCGRILVIDDDRDLAEGLGDILRDLGHTVEIAFTGSEALEIARRFDAQIALVDIKLGRTSGLELIGSLKELRPGIVNVVITANAGKESVIASLRSGAFDFLNKPMHPQDLFVIIDRCFAQIRLQEAQAGASGKSAPDFVANVSHELRDPLNAVIGFSEILGDEMLGPLGSEQYVHYARGINEAGHHLTTVIDDLIDQRPPASRARQDDTPADVDPDAAGRDDAAAGQVSAEPVPGEPRRDDTGAGEFQALDPEPGVPFSKQGDDLGPDPVEWSSDQTRDGGQEPATPAPGEPQEDLLHPQPTWSTQPQTGLAESEEPLASRDGSDEAQSVPGRPEPEEAGFDAGAQAPAARGDVDPAAPLFSGIVWDGGRPSLPESSQPQPADIQAASDPPADPWSTETEPGRAEFRPASGEDPERAWPDTDLPHRPGAEPPRFHPGEPEPSEPAWQESPWDLPKAAEVTPAEHDTPEMGWDEPPSDDFTLAPPSAGQPPYGHGQMTDADEDQEEEETEEEAPEVRESLYDDQGNEGHEEKIVKLSPFRKVI